MCQPNPFPSAYARSLTSAAIDARDHLRAGKDGETSAHLPEGTLVTFTGGKDFGNVTAIWRSLDSIKIKFVAFPGSGITNNLVDKARKVGIPVLLAAA